MAEGPTLGDLLPERLDAVRDRAREELSQNKDVAGMKQLELHVALEIKARQIQHSVFNKRNERGMLAPVLNITFREIRHHISNRNRIQDGVSLKGEKLFQERVCEATGAGTELDNINRLTTVERAPVAQETQHHASVSISDERATRDVMRNSA